MKIDADLRAAIRSAEKLQPYHNYEQSKKIEKAAIESLLTTPKASATFKKARALKAKAQPILARGQALSNEASKLFESLGLNCDGGRICDHVVFAKNGGKFSTFTRWTFDQVMGRLAVADPKERQKILLEYGIRWE